MDPVQATYDQYNATDPSFSWQNTPGGSSSSYSSWGGDGNAWQKPWEEWQYWGNEKQEYDDEEWAEWEKSKEEQQRQEAEAMEAEAERRHWAWEEDAQKVPNDGTFTFGQRKGA